MRKSKIVLLLALALAAIMVLSSCGAGASKFADILDGSRYKGDTPSWTAAAKVDALQDAAVVDQSGNLVVLTKENADGFDTYMIFNMKTGTVVYNATESAAVDVDIDLCTTDNYDADYAVVVLTTWVLDSENHHTNAYSYVVSLRDAAGTEFATATRMTALPEVEWDLLRFEGKCYRVSKEGTFTLVGDYSEFAPLPNIAAETEKYYYAINAATGTVIVYDKSLAIVSYYNMPTYANVAASQAFALDAEKVFVQYTVEEDPYTDDYDIYDPATNSKSTLHTFVLNPDGKVKEIRCDYVIADGGVLNDEQRDWSGLSDSFTSFAIVYPVEDQRVNLADTARRWASVDKNGKIKEIKNPTLVPFENFVFVQTNRWVVTTSDNRAYLINEKAEILGEVTGANGIQAGRSYFTANGKVYDYDMNVIFDYTAANYTIARRLNHGIIFTSVDNEPVLFANGTTTTLVAKDDETKVLVNNLFGSMLTGSSYYVIRNMADLTAQKLVFYNDVGTAVITLDYTPGYPPQVAYTAEGRVLLAAPIEDPATAEITVSYYIFG